ncbi:MAG: PrsW family intramembrane metalloprotease [Treponema sp.]|jgi:RsiW-degrading membrane proteinase PrsW (M82 family)|nr:PrsW family intramembrane metalloprotease [Treponema sp.]
MNGLWVLLLLIAISALPVLAVLLWIRLRRLPVKSSWFLLALLGGALSLGLAAVLQSLFPETEGAGLGVLLAKIFIQIALTEELGRLAVFSLLLSLAHRMEPHSSGFAAITGLIAGLGFAVVETAIYGAGNFSIALGRAITAAPLHGACGIRIGVAVFHIRRAPAKSLIRFLYAVTLHGMYNFIILSHGIPLVFPILIAFSALFSSIKLIRFSGDSV